ncbi:MAG TPA: DUF2934 domain-containing protein [Microvirga sp.]|nr:DUF2934 domain-containing protein [Microvirga sp.]
MDDREERIRMRAYEIWERQGRTGDPQDHWLEAEREIEAQDPQASSADRPEATVQEASPVEAVEAQEAAGNGAARGRRSSSKASRE